MKVYPQTGAGQVYGEAEQYETRWCVYQHAIMLPDSTEPQLIYIGCCKLTELYNFPDARRNTHWAGMVRPTTALYITLMLTGGRVECLNALAAIRERPVCNMKGYDMGGQSTAVTCVETGVTYPTQTAAAKALGITQGALSNHLARRPGARTVGGLTFRKGK